MRDRFTIILAWLAFTAVMLAVGWALKLVVPPFNEWLGATMGQGYALLAIGAFFLACGVFGFWPRDPAGRLRRLPTRR